MAWDASPFAGFSTGEPWLPMHADWRQRNAAAQAEDPASMLSLYRALLALRRSSPALSIGSFALHRSDDNVLVYERSAGEERMLIALNLDDREKELIVPAEAQPNKVLVSTLGAPPPPGRLRANEGLVIRLAAA